MNFVIDAYDLLIILHNTVGCVELDWIIGKSGKIMSYDQYQ